MRALPFDCYICILYTLLTTDGSNKRIAYWLFENISSLITCYYGILLSAMQVTANARISCLFLYFYYATYSIHCCLWNMVKVNTITTGPPFGGLLVNLRFQMTVPRSGQKNFSVRRTVRSQNMQSPRGDMYIWHFERTKRSCRQAAQAT